MLAALSSFLQADYRHTFCLWLDLPVLGLLRCRVYYYSYQCLLPFSHLPFLKERYFSCPDSLLPLTDHLGQDKDCFLIAKYRTYFACQYQQNHWHYYPQAQDHLCCLLDPGVLVALSGLTGPIGPCAPAGPISPLGPGGPTVSLVVWLVSPIRPLIYPIIYLHRNFSSLIFGACHSKRKNIFYRWRDLTCHDQHLSHPQSACFLVEEI